MKINKSLRMSFTMIMFGVFTLLFAGCAFTQEGNREMVHLTYVADSVVELDIEKGTICSSIEVPTKEGYRFVGWYKDENFSVEFPSGYPVMEDMTLYAKFERLTYNVKFISGPGYRFLTDNVYVAEYGDSYTFSLEVFEGYDDTNMKVMVGEKVLSANPDGTYTIENIKSPLTVKVTGLRSLKHYKVYLPNETKGYSIVSLSDTQLIEGETYRFCVSIDPAYSKSNYIVKANDKIIHHKNNVYEITNVHEDIYITVENIVANKYYVTFTGVDYAIESLDNNLVNHGSSYSFSLNFDDKFDTAHLIVSANGKVISDAFGEYTVENITEDVSIDVSGYFIKEVKVYVEEHEGCEILLDHHTYFYGNSATLMITIKEGYEANNLVVMCDGNSVLGDNNIFVLNNLTSDVFVTIDGVNRIEIPVHIVNGTGYTITMNKDKLYYGDTVYFKVVAHDGYDASDAIIVVNGRSSLSNEIVIENVKEMLNIEAKDVVRKKFSVFCKDSEGVTINVENDSIYYGEDLHFTICIDSDYDDTNAKLLINRKLHELDTNIVKDVTEDITIEVRDMVKKSFSIVILDSLGASLVTSVSKVDIHGDVNVNINVLDSYDASTLILHVNDETIILHELNYTITDICENLVIYLEDLSLKTFKISREIPEGVSVSIIPDVVSYGDNLHFGIVAHEGYLINDIIVKVNGTAISSIDGEYFISDIKENITITIKNVLKEKFHIAIPSGTGYSIIIESSLDIEFGDTFIFAIKLEEGFRLIEVYANDESLIECNEFYILKNIRENKIIRVEVEKIPDENPIPDEINSTFKIADVTFYIVGLELDEYTFVDYFEVEGDILKFNKDVLTMYDITINGEELFSFDIFDIAGVSEVTIVFVEK